MKYCLIIDDDWRNYECFYIESQYYELLQHCYSLREKDIVIVKIIG